MKFKDRLSLLRKEMNLTQTEFAEKIGFSRTAISAWEIGRNEPSNEDTIKIADFFGVSVDYIIGKSNYRNDEEYVNAMIKENDEFIKKQYKKYGAKKESNVFPMADEAVPIPVVGKISAGLPILATENIERYEFAPSSMIKEGFTYFYLTVIRR